MFTERLTGTEECQGMRLHEDDLRPCPAKCECAYVREVLQVITSWPKSESLIERAIEPSKIGWSSSVRRGKGTYEKNLCFVCGYDPGEFIVPLLLSEIIKRLPEIELNVDISDSLLTIKKVKTGVLELGIVGTRYDSDEIEYLQVMKDDRPSCNSTPCSFPCGGERNYPC